MSACLLHLHGRLVGEAWRYLFVLRGVVALEWHGTLLTKFII